MPENPPGFDDPVPHNGYRWWYVDAISDDGAHALTAIVFIGSVFSPWYRRARLRGVTPALKHCAVNLALYGPVRRWCMTERADGDVVPTARSLTIGPSQLSLDSERLTLSIRERGMPLPRRLAGTLEIAMPKRSCAEAVTLDADGHHQWQALAPQTRITVRLTHPQLSWEGDAYADSNRGAVPLEDSFDTWHWSRTHAPDGSTRVRYDVTERGGLFSSRTLDIDADGASTAGAHGQDTLLPATRWFRMPRPARLADGAEPLALQTLEDAPFYSRSRFMESIGGERRATVHESLDLQRFVKRSTQLMLPFRAPRLPYTRTR